MKRTGYPAYYASAVEAVASTGGNFMPPVMGASAFLMAVFLGIPYLSVVVAAIIPALMYYFALYMQVHFYGISHNLRGLDSHEIPPLRQTLKEIWPSLLSILVLVFFLYLGLEGRAPFAAAALLIVLSMRKKAIRNNLWDFFFGIFEDSARQLARLCGILVGIGFIMGSFAATGVASSFAHELMMLAGGNLILMLIFCALASLILGTGMPVNACYIFLAVTIAPALVNLGIVPIAAHLFIFYLGMASYLTPPVAEGAYVAATLGNANFFKTGLTSMRLGIVVYLVPFSFVLQPSLLLQGKLVELVVPLITSMIGIFFMTGGLEGWFPRIGLIPKYLRLPLFVSGILLILSEFKTDIAGTGLFLLIAAVYLLVSRKNKRPRLFEPSTKR
jgi:TRAP transporter 4TM/12TM fusion protein